MKRILEKILILVPLSVLLFACSVGGARTEPSRSSEDVLSTAKAIAEITREATFRTPPPTPIPPTKTVPPPTNTPETTNTPVPSTTTVTASYNAYLRVRPGEDQPHVDFFLQDQVGIVVGKFENSISGTWWLIQRVGEGKDGWIWSGAVTFAGDAESVPLIEDALQ